MGSKAKAGSQEFLKKHVLDEGLCTGCGACVNLCPYQVIYHDRTVQLHKCDLEDGQCYSFCPRAATDLTALRKLLFEQDDMTPEIGAVKGYYFAQAVDPELRAAAQHGATVTVLMELALAEGLIDSAIVSIRDQDFMQNGAM
jgi:coenzyme F420 hydrogenase subunit beta